MFESTKCYFSPLQFELRMEYVEIGEEKRPDLEEQQIWCMGKGRYAAEHWIHSHPNNLPCDLSNEDYVWNYDGLPNSDFTLDLKRAPRFDKQKYAIADVCANTDWGFSLQDRLDEFWDLYGERVPKSWWSWKFFS